MSTLSTTNLKNPSSGSNNIVLNTDGTTTIAAPSNIIKSGTAVASTSGTVVDFTGIPSWVKRVTVMFDGVSWNNTVSPVIRLGDSGGVETTGYNSIAGFSSSASAAGTGYSTSGFNFTASWSSDYLFRGSIIFTLLDVSTNTWTAQGAFFADSAGGIYALTLTGSKSLSGTLTRVRVVSTTAVTFDAGTINILYEG